MLCSERLYQEFSSLFILYSGIAATVIHTFLFRSVGFVVDGGDNISGTVMQAPLSSELGTHKTVKARFSLGLSQFLD